MEANKPCPYKVIPFTKEENEQHKKHYKVNVDRLIHVGEKGYTLPEHFLKHASWVRNFPIRSDDTFIVAYPRSGSTLTQELVWLIYNDLDFEKAKTMSLRKRSPLIDSYVWVPPKYQDVLNDILTLQQEYVTITQEQRILKSHLPLSLLPANLLATCKVIYVARDMRDVAVSKYHLDKVFKLAGLVTDNFETYYKEVFSKNLCYVSPYFEHVKEGWEKRNHPNMFFLRYEDLSKDLNDTVRRVAEFLGKTYTNQQLDQLCDHLKFDNFQKNKTVDMPVLRSMGFLEEGKNFIRKGKVGGWRDYFDEEMTQHADNWIKQELLGTGLSFQHSADSFIPSGCSCHF